jgi:hypothetical protein
VRVRVIVTIVAVAVAAGRAVRVAATARRTHHTTSSSFTRISSPAVTWIW